MKPDDNAVGDFRCPVCASVGRSGARHEIDLFPENGSDLVWVSCPTYASFNEWDVLGCVAFKGMEVEEPTKEKHEG